MENSASEIDFSINTINSVNGVNAMPDEPMKKPRAPQNDKLPPGFPKILPKTHPERFVLKEEAPKKVTLKWSMLHIPLSLMTVLHLNWTS